MANSQIQYVSFRGVDNFLAKLAGLSEKAGFLPRSGFEKELSSAMGQYYDDGDYIDESVGTAWISRNPARFAASVPDPYMFLMNHLEQPHCSEVLICHPSVLQVLSLGQRIDYVHAAYVRNGARNNMWVKAALESGLTKAQIAQTILMHLEKGAVDNQQENVATRYNDFLAYGAEHTQLLRLPPNDPANWYLDPQGPWGVCSQEEFLKAIEHCVQKAPHRVLEYRDKLKVRLTPEQIYDYCVQAAEKLETLRCQRLQDLLLLPQETRKDLLSRVEVDGSNPALYVQLFIHTLVGALNSEEFYSRLSHRLDALDAKAVYMAAHTALAEYEGPIVPWIRAMLGDRLRLAGYRVGTVQEGNYWHRKSGSTQRQWFVDFNGTRYVQQRGDHRYFPKKGDRVIFRPEQGVVLTPQVKAVFFTPVSEN